MQRAAFSPLPLTVQIDRIDGLLDSVDNPLKKLKTLSDKTRLPQRLQIAITTLFYRAKVAVVRREQAKVIRDLSVTTKQARRERQLIRYGKAYRIGIQEQMREMRQNIVILQTKQTEYKKYHTFVRMLEIKVEQFRAAKGFMPPLPLKDEWQQKIAAGKRVKIAIEAEKLRMLLPTEYKATTPKGRLIGYFKESAEVTTAHNLNEGATIKILDNNHGTEKTTQDRETNGQEAVQPALETTTAKPWKIAANVKTIAMLNNIAQELQQSKTADLTKPTLKAEGLRSAFSDRPLSEKRTTTMAAMYKVKAEAEQARNKIPPEHRPLIITREAEELAQGEILPQVDNGGEATVPAPLKVSFNTLANPLLKQLANTEVRIDFVPS